MSSTIYIHTEKNHILNLLKDIKNYDKIQEPCTGIGHVLHYILKYNINIKYTGIELHSDFIFYLNLLYPKNIYSNINFINHDYLNSNIDEKYDIIFLNPPYNKLNL